MTMLRSSLLAHTLCYSSQFVLVHLGGGMTALESGLQAMDAAMGLLK